MVQNVKANAIITFDFIVMVFVAGYVINSIKMYDKQVKTFKTHFPAHVRWTSLQNNRRFGSV